MDCQETYFDFSSWDAGESVPVPEEVFDETGFERAERPPDMPDMDRELNADESEDRVGNLTGMELEVPREVPRHWGRCLRCLLPRHRR